MKQVNGLFTGVVTDNQDPERIGRVRVQIPGTDEDIWARIATLMAGNDRGTWFIPEVNDEVLVGFEEGAVRRAYVIGGLWSKASPPPEKMAESNNRKVLRSRNGVKITLDDESGQESCVVETPGGQKITLKDGPGSVDIRDSNGNSVTLAAGGISVNAAAKVTINASEVEVNAGMVNVNAAMSKFSGVVQCDTLISNNVVSSSYSPGAGNVW
jgi:phage baseplate assembly protein V